MERDKLILGARAPSPALSAKRENSYSVKRFEFERAAHARAGEGARAPVLTSSLQIGSSFWAKHRVFILHDH